MKRSLMLDYRMRLAAGLAALASVAGQCSPGKETQMQAFEAVRRPAVADQFYPGDAAKLAAVIDRYLEAAGTERNDGIRALVSPHAGYVYSGATAALGFGAVQGRDDIRRVVVIAPSHRCAFRGLSVGQYGHFETPLGRIPVDVEACRALLAATPLFTDRNDAHAREHALEVQLPFLQRALPNGFSLVPLVCGSLDATEIRTAGRALAELLWKPGTLWVISSDFTHYGDAFGYTPFRKDVEAGLKELDGGAVGKICARNLDGFLEYVDQTGATICGRTPIAILLAALEAEPPSVTCSLLGYTTSGRLTHDFSHSVSYAALAVVAESAEPRPAAPAGFALSDGEKAELLRLARAAIRARLTGEKADVAAKAGLTATLERDGAAFVSLHLDGRLRGCIGNLVAEEPLYLNVVHNAVSAAFRDPRFLPLTAGEFDRIGIEISVLTPPRKIPSLAQFVIGRHGIILAKHGRRAVFLPQVAPEQGWDVETTMTHLALKAGLKADDWKRGATYEVFEAIVFHE